jgi:RimJ/RimL family protein N-acetyltransferase
LTTATVTTTNQPKDNQVNNRTIKEPKTDGKAGQSDQAEVPIINMRGTKVGLGPATRASVPLVTKWENDFAVDVWSGDSFEPRTLEFEQEGYDRHFVKNEHRDWFGFQIYELATMRLIGVSDIRHIDGVHGTAEMGIMIGEPDCWGKGYGTEAVILMLDYAFNGLNLHSMMLDTSSFNERAMRAYRKAGFREIGRRREAKRIAGRLYDVVYMDCLATEFKSPLPPVIPTP